MQKNVSFFLFFFYFMHCLTYSNNKDNMNQINIKQLSIYNKKHHRSNGFKNPYPPPPERSFIKSFLWISEKILSGEQENKIFPADFQPIEKDTIKNNNSEYQFFWIGHSTVYIKTPMYSFITDPQFSERASPVSFAGPIRHRPPAIAIKDLPDLHYVLISHNHYDHLDEASIKEIHKTFDPVFFVPLKVSNILKDWGIQKIIELDWWQYVEIEHFKIYCTPARHFSARSLTDRNETLWSGWFIKDEQANFSFYFAGDTGYERFFKEIRKYIGKPDVSLIPIGAFQPRWFMREVHVDPIEAFQAFLDLDSDHLLPIHWGTFYLAEEPMNLPPKLLREEYEKWKILNPDEKKSIHILKIGESLKLKLKDRIVIK